MRKLTLITKLVAAASAMMTIQVFATTNLVYYSFNASNTIADVGSLISSFGNAGVTTNAFNAGSTLNVQPGFVAGVAPNENLWTGNTNYFSVTLDSTGFQGLVLSFWDQKSSTGPTNIAIAYSTTGPLGTFSFLPSVLATVSPGAIVTQDVSAVTALDNNPNDVFRIYGLNAGGSAGTLRIDNLTVDAMAVVPEPSTLVLAGAGFLGMLMIRRRRS
ncbi:MAG TPA: PEP-CTERM sorting domain-containing protein [Verrucomicrobiae bacterium]|nr:PEP-CTERM sorting domain-containing protein [Verrucomicrobiae bacterium]